jgi:hypothetical protein
MGLMHAHHTYLSCQCPKPSTCKSPLGYRAHIAAGRPELSSDTTTKNGECVWQRSLATRCAETYFEHAHQRWFRPTRPGPQEQQQQSLRPNNVYVGYINTNQPTMNQTTVDMLYLFVSGSLSCSLSLSLSLYDTNLSRCGCVFTTKNLTRCRIDGLDLLALLLLHNQSGKSLTRTTTVRLSRGKHIQ